MKKFLGKLPVMITFVSLAVVMLIAYIGLLVRPVAVGFTYKGEMDIGMGEMEMVVKVKSGSKVDVKVDVDGTSMELEDVRYIEHDRELLVLLNYGTMQPLELTDKEYKEMKEDIIKDWDTYKEAAFDINAFEMGEDGDSLTCTGSIVFAIVGGVVLVALLTFGTLSVLYFVKGRKK